MVLVDDFALFRLGLRLLIGSLWADARVLEAAHPEVLRDGAQATGRADLLLLGCGTDAGRRREALAQCASLWRGTPVMAVLDEDDPGLMVDLRAEGAVAIISRRARPEAIAQVLQQWRSNPHAQSGKTVSARALDDVPMAVPLPRHRPVTGVAVRQAASRGRAWDEGSCEREAASAPLPNSGRIASAMGELSRRQVEVLRLLAAGQTNKQIGRTLGVAESTIKTHLSSLFQRLGVTTRTEAVLAAASMGLGSAAPLQTL